MPTPHSPEHRPDIGRKASKEVRKQQLVESTIRVLAQKGYSTLTVADVAREAGLSTGIIIFHFTSKDELLASVLRFLADEYYRNWRTAMDQAGSDPAARLGAMLLSDFDSGVYTPEKLSAWIAFWGENQGRPVYDNICGAYDRERHDAALSTCTELIAMGGYSHDAEITIQALEAMSDGLWLGVVNAGSGLSGRVTVAGARAIMQSALAAYFPRHFVMPLA